MNHSFSIDMANHFADRIGREGSEKSEQIRAAFMIAYLREPTEAEVVSAIKLIDRFGLRAFCRALLNSNELIYLR